MAADTEHDQGASPGAAPSAVKRRPGKPPRSAATVEEFLKDVKFNEPNAQFTEVFNAMVRNNGNGMWSTAPYEEHKQPYIANVLAAAAALKDLAAPFVAT